MAGIEAARLRVNPAAPSQYMVLWTNGRITPGGGALDPMSVSGTPPFVWGPNYTEAQAVLGPAKDFVVIDWSAPSGYVLDYFGDIHPWGPSASLPAAAVPAPAHTAPLAIVNAFVMNPAGNGQGYEVYTNGTVVAFGGAPAIAGGPSLPNSAQDLEMEWATKKYIVLDRFGKLWPRQGAAVPVVYDTFASRVARSVVVTDWGGTGGIASGYVLDQYGGVHAFGTGATFSGTPPGSGWPGYDIARDLAVVHDGTDPAVALQFAELDGLGGVHFGIISTPPRTRAGTDDTSSIPADPTTDTTRPRLAFTYHDDEADALASSRVLVYSTAQLAFLTDQVQSLAPTIGISGGTFRLRFGGELTAAIAWNATAATIRTALEALYTIDPGDLTVTGGPINSSPVFFHFTGHLGHAKQPTIHVAVNGLTGGGSPRLDALITVPGTDVWTDVVRASALWSGEDSDPNRRSWDSPVDTYNGTWRMFVQVTDASGQSSPTHSTQWTQAVTLPATPTLTATDRGGMLGISVTPSFASSPAGALFVIEFSDDYDPSTGVGTWDELRYAVADEVGAPDPGGAGITLGGLDWTLGDLGVTLGGGAGSGSFDVNTRIDYEAPFGVKRWYRCRQFSLSPYLSSQNSAPVGATLTGGVWVISDPYDHHRSLELKVAPPEQFSRDFPNTPLFGAGAKFPIIGSTGPLRGKTYTRVLRLDHELVYIAFEQLIEDNPVLLIRDPFGRLDYVRFLGTAQWEQPHAAPSSWDQGRGFPTRHFHNVSVQLLAQARPRVTDPAPFVAAAG